MGHQKSLFTKVRIHFLAKAKKPSWKVLFVLPIALVISVATLILVDNKPTSAYPCPCHVFSAPTGQSDFDDGTGLELGFKFKSQISGYITGVRFYKQGSMSGTHVGSLWQSGSGVNLASATFISESGSGWQDVTFSSPVAVTADTLYVASVTMPDGKYIASPNYFLTDQTNYPLVVPSSSNAPGNGVYSTTPGIYPASNSGNASNYWIDVDFKATNVPTPPTVDTVSPANGSTNVVPGASLTAAFDMAMNPDSFTSSSFIVQDDQNNVLGSTVSFDTATGIATYIPDNGFATGKTYTATLKSGGGSAVQNIDGTPMSADYTWSFTVSATNSCPCSLKDRAAPIGAGTFDDLGSLELGTKIVPQTNGYITSVRFYKPITMPETTHDVHVWSSTGVSLATATTSNESDYGWQEVRLSSPVHVLAGSLYIVSYTTPSAVYMSSANGLASTISNGYLTAYADGDSHNTATGSGTHNGVFTLTAGAYPNSGTSNFYWVDAVFSTDSTSVIKPAVDSAQPSNASYGVPRASKIKARLTRAMNASTITNSSVQLLDSNNVVVSATASYDAANYTINVTPGSALAYGQKYTVRLTNAIMDADGNAIDNYSWSFTTGSQLSTNPAAGPGGPILVITSSGNHYSDYYAEMLRTEGLNYFDVKDIQDVTASTLGGYSQAILGQTALSQSQADMFTSWVQDGGDLIAMRPDSKLADLLGLTTSGTTRSNGYLAVDTSSAPGTGIVSDTIQYKGTADDYTLSGATKVATLYTDATTSTSNPAVTYRQVGSKGGSAAAFTYDLAKAVIALHQGNQTWAGGDRDGDSVIRTDDMYFGAKAGDTQPDWVDLNKVHIPQADEQQRLMANILTEAAKDAQPLPRFWYLPHDYKAAMVLAGDDHGLANKDGTEKVFNNWLSDSPTGCSAADWQCVRASGYVYNSAALTNARAAQFENAGFDLGAHPPGDGGGCNNYTSYAALGVLVAGSLSDFHVKYTSLPNQRTTRYHCYVWSDWDSQPRVDLDNGIRYDLDYVTYPLSWIANKAAVITGSGMNMRLTDTTGSLIDVHQGVTNFENTVANSTTIGAVLDNATGANGFYGIFGTHYDMSDSFNSTLYDSAASHNVPMISADQALSWLDGHGSSTFSNFSGTYGKVNFDIAAAEGAVGLKAMMPIHDAGGTIASLQTGGADVTYQTQTVKGVQYAVFDAVPGSYAVTYSDYTEPVTGGGSGGAGGNTTQDATKKPAKNTGASNVFSGDASGLDDATSGEEQNQEPSTQDETPNTNDEKGKTVIQTDRSSDNSWVKWLIAFGLLGLIAGILIGITIHRRRRHTPTW